MVPSHLAACARLERDCRPPHRVPGELALETLGTPTEGLPSWDHRSAMTGLRPFRHAGDSSRRTAT